MVSVKEQMSVTSRPTKDYSDVYHGTVTVDASMLVSRQALQHDRIEIEKVVRDALAAQIHNMIYGGLTEKLHELEEKILAIKSLHVFDVRDICDWFNDLFKELNKNG
jgi:hypothetical protein